MTDPYQILGIPSTASDDQVKNAYRELARKYHPDNYINNPLADLAQEKMKEINEAYDQIQRERKAGGGSYSRQQSYSSGGYRQSGTGYSGSSFPDIRRLINLNRIADAEELLDGIPTSSRDAEWHFLKGSVFYTKGWLDEAYNYFSQALRMNPNNPEYRSALNQMNWQRATGRNQSYHGDYRTSQQTYGCSGCDICSSLLCADCCCECMGGDLISCC